MDAVVKVGGSLLAYPEALRSLCRMLDSVSKDWSVVAVPGGGTFADEVRTQYRRFNLSEETAHRMAVLAMNLYGDLLCELLRNGVAVTTLRTAGRFARMRKLPVLLPAELMSKPNPLAASWDVTSDTIAAYIAHALNARRLVLVTDVDGLFTTEPKGSSEAKLMPSVHVDELSRIEARTCVDKALSTYLRNRVQETWILNGLRPERLLELFDGGTPVSTRIVA